MNMTAFLDSDAAKNSPSLNITSVDRRLPTRNLEDDASSLPSGSNVVASCG